MPDTIKHGRRRWFQFGLGTMLVVMTLVAVGLWWTKDWFLTTPMPSLLSRSCRAGRP